MKKVTKRLWAMLLALVMTVTMIPALGGLAFADDAATISVFLTVSNKGALATANDDSLMAVKPVQVADLDGNGSFTVDEALVAAHAAYNQPDGYVVSAGQVKKFWGVETSNLLFFVNDVGLSNGVTEDTVQDGDFVVASINTDDELYSDYFTSFEDKNVEALVGEQVTLNLFGRPGMSSGPDALVKNPVAGVDVKAIALDGTETALGKTDESGNITFNCPAAGTYVITASGDRSRTQGPRLPSVEERGS